MHLTIHRGTQEIGGSCVELRTETTRIVLDIGLPLVEKDGSDFNFSRYKHLDTACLIAEGLLPDIDGLYDNSGKVDAVLISHAHQDHYGLGSHLNKSIPVYLSSATKDLIELSNLFTPQDTQLGECRHFESGKMFEVGDFRIIPFLMDHSAFDSYAFLIEAGDKSVFYTGDFRKNGRKSGAMDYFFRHAPNDIDCLIMEGTGIAGSKGSNRTEVDIENDMLKLFKEPGKCNLVNASGQNIDRIVSVYKACLKAGKTLVVDVYLAAILDTLKKYAKLPYPNDNYKVKVLFTKYTCDRVARLNRKDILYQFKDFKVTKEEISADSDKYVILIRPSMQFDLEKMPDIDGGNLIYSLWKGYLKKGSTHKLVEYLKSRNFSVHHIHTSGHADPETLKQMTKALNPKVIIPIHTFHGDEYKKQFAYPVRELKDKEEYKL